MIASHELSAWPSAVIKNNLEMERIGDYAESIARLLPLKPRVILMDKPCSALDTRAINAVEELIAGLRNGYTIIIVTSQHSQGPPRQRRIHLYTARGDDRTRPYPPPKKKSKTSDYIEGH